MTPDQEYEQTLTKQLLETAQDDPLLTVALALHAPAPPPPPAPAPHRPGDPD